MFKRFGKWIGGLAAAFAGGAAVVLTMGQQVRLDNVPTVEARMSPTSTQQPIANFEDTTRLHNGDLIGSVLAINGKIVRMSQYLMTGLPDGAHATATMYTTFPVKR